MSPIVVDAAGSPVEGRVKAHNDAAVAELEAVWTADQVHRVGKVPDNPATPYAVVSASLGLGRNYRVGSVHTSKSYRLMVQLVGRDYDEVAFAAEKADAAFLDRPLGVAGHTTTPARRELDPTVQRDPDGGAYLYALATYTFLSSPDV